MRLRPDTVWSDGETPVDTVNAQDYATIQLAVDAVTDSGGVVYIPAGDYNYSGTGDYETTKFTSGLVVPDKVKLKGAGRGVTILHANEPGNGGAGDEADDIILLQGDNCGIEDLTIQGPCHLATLADSNTGRGVVVGPADEGDQYGNFLRRVVILDTAGYGLYVGGSEVTDMGVSFLGNYEEVRVWNQAEQASLYLGAGTTTNTFRKCVFLTISSFNTGNCNAASSVLIAGTEGAVFDNCTFEGYANETADEIPFILFDKDTGAAAIACQFQNCWFELAATASTTGQDSYYVKTSTGALIDVSFEGCHIVRSGGADATDHKGGKFFENGSGATTHQDIVFERCNAWVGGDPTDSPGDALLEVDCEGTASASNFIVKHCSTHNYSDTTKYRAWRFYNGGNTPTSQAFTKGCMNFPIVDDEIYNTTYLGGIVNGRLIYYVGATGPFGDGTDGLFFYGFGPDGAGPNWYKIDMTILPA